MAQQANVNSPELSFQQLATAPSTARPEENHASWRNGPVAQQMRTLIRTRSVSNSTAGPEKITQALPRRPQVFHEVFSNFLPFPFPFHASKTSVFPKAFPKTEKGDFQNERFLRNFHKDWEWSLPKWASPTRLSQNENHFRNKRFPRDSQKLWKCYPHTVPKKLCEQPSKHKKKQFYPHSALDTYDLRRRLRARCTTQLYLHSVPSARVISAHGCTHSLENAILPAFRASHTHDLCRKLPARSKKHHLTCIPRLRQARCRQRVAPGPQKTQFYLHSAPLTLRLRRVQPADCKKRRSAPPKRTISVRTSWRRSSHHPPVNFR